MLGMTEVPTDSSINALTIQNSSFLGHEAKEIDAIIWDDSGGTNGSSAGGNSNGSSNASTGNIPKCYESAYLRSIYPYALPVMIFFCVLSIFVNVLIVASARWCRRPMTPTLYFSISLASADALASVALATSLVVHSLLPCVFGIQIFPPHPTCVSLVFEIFRLGTILITVKHLLALGINHWIGIIRPLHYAATMTRRTAWLVIIICWASPILLLFIYFSAHPNQGFRIKECRQVDIFNKRAFRAIFASLFFAPFLIMSMIYLHIFLIVKKHHQHRLRYQSCQQLRRNIKAVVTTVLILGTYVLGWMPGILWFISVCDDCFVKLPDIRQEVTLPVNVVLNTLIILKAFVNPIIYAARMSDIQMALKKMRYDIMSRFCGKCAPEQPPLDPLERGSLCESRSLRKPSCGSSSSARRPGTIPSINAATTSPLNPTRSFNQHNSSNTGSHSRNHNGNANSNSVALEMSEWTH